jgi:hypothetical protein
MVGTSQKIDSALTLVRIGFFFGDYDLINENLKKADKCVRCLVVFFVVEWLLTIRRCRLIEKSGDRD